MDPRLNYNKLNLKISIKKEEIKIKRKFKITR